MSSAAVFFHFVSTMERSCRAAPSRQAPLVLLGVVPQKSLGELSEPVWAVLRAFLAADGSASSTCTLSSSRTGFCCRRVRANSIGGYAPTFSRFCFPADAVHRNLTWPSQPA